MSPRRVLVSLLIAATSAVAQNQTGRSADPLRTGVIEFGISGGYAAGDVGGARIDLPGVITYKVEGRPGPAGKLHIGLGMSPRYQFVAEAAFLGGGRGNADLGGGFKVETKTNAILGAASVHVRFPVGSRFVPYLAVGAGSVQSRSDTLVNYTAPVRTAGAASDAATQVRLKEGSFASLAGAGVQFFPSKSRVGLRFEAKSYFPTGSSRTPFVQITLGVFTWLR